VDAAGRIPVQMFFYGTLKRGGSNHAYCRGGRMTAEARVEGLLYDLPEGYPALVVPEASVLAVGTGDPLRDARGAGALHHPELPEPREPYVHGELYTFDDPEERLPSLDELEDFSPDDPPARTGACSSRSTPMAAASRWPGPTRSGARRARTCPAGVGPREGAEGAGNTKVPRPLEVFRSWTPDRRRPLPLRG
jgi:gamma-glutamylcyclotransferase (GGCT)/AIG2-like uncharacterized protein YtfP